MTKEKEVSKEQYPEMANEEYRVEINKICEGIESNRLLRYFYMLVLKKAKDEQLIDYQVSVPDYTDMIIENICKIGSNTQVMQYIHIIIKDVIGEVKE